MIEWRLSDKQSRFRATSVRHGSIIIPKSFIGGCYPRRVWLRYLIIHFPSLPTPTYYLFNYIFLRVVHNTWDRGIFPCCGWRRAGLMGASGLLGLHGTWSLGWRQISLVADRRYAGLREWDACSINGLDTYIGGGRLGGSGLFLSNICFLMSIFSINMRCRHWPNFIMGTCS